MIQPWSTKKNSRFCVVEYIFLPPHTGSILCSWGEHLLSGKNHNG